MEPDDRVWKVVREPVSVVPYDPQWPVSFAMEKAHLLRCLPGDLVRRIEHFGSTAVPGLWAKPVIDILVEVTDLDETRRRIVPILTSQSYDYFWRPTSGDDGPPFYAWFIKRDRVSGERTHHIHMVEGEFREHWDRLLFRDHLIARPQVARRYEELKLGLARLYPRDRRGYTRGKAAFIEEVMAELRETARRSTKA